MEKPDWGQSLLIGNTSMDLEHRLQIGLIHALDEALRAGQPNAEVAKILAQLYEYTNAHFLAENLLMRLHAYPDYAAHADEHDRLVGSLESLRRTFAAGETSMTLESIESLRSWLAVHIQGMDQRLSTYVAENGIPVVRRA
jgi:hemerythrin-like metal-binding protein